MRNYLALSLVLTLILSNSYTALAEHHDKTEKKSENKHKIHFGYDGKVGPEHWGDLSQEFTLCKIGKAQAPINIETKTAKKAPTENIGISYSSVPLKVINNGHTIQVNYDKGSSVRVNNKEYKLLQFHFHAPSEHKIGGKAADMEVHLVHKSDDGKLLVIGRLMKNGRKNDFIQNIWDHLPATEGTEKVTELVKINAQSLLPAKKSYINYQGSLTTPPCSEGVNWFVMKEPIELSKEQIVKFTSIFKVNARPVQPLNGRVIKESM